MCYLQKDTILILVQFKLDYLLEHYCFLAIPLIVSEFYAVLTGELILNNTIYNFVREPCALLFAKALNFIENQSTHLVK